MDFASLAIKRATIQQKEKDRYLVLRYNGDRKVVAADSAADAVEISGFKDIRKVINLAFEFDQILEKGALAATDETFLTRTTLEEALTEFYTADLLDEETQEDSFIECDMLEFAALNHIHPEEIPSVIPAEPVPLQPEQEQVKAAQEPEKTEEPKKQVEIIDAPVEHPLQETEKQLSQEEIEALLKPE